MMESNQPTGQQLTPEECECKLFEQWLDIEGFEGRYKISSRGRVYSVLKDELVKPATDKLGYKYLTLSKDKVKVTRKVHRLVADAFLKRTEGRNSVNHMDKNTSHNCVCNLQFVNTRENNLHAIGYTGEMPIPIQGIFKNIPVKLTKGEKTYEFSSPHSAMEFLGVKESSMHSSRRIGIRLKGYKVEFLK